MHARTRRDFLRDGVSCAGHLVLAAALAPAAARGLWAQDATFGVVAREPFGRLEQVADGVWALVSTPLTGDRTTLSNGGLIAGRSGVLAIEGFMMPEGAAWLAAQSRALTGRWPTHVVVTHYHADHASGIAGYRDGVTAPLLHATPETADLVRGALPATPLPGDAARREALAQSVALAAETTTLDLGGRRVRLVRRHGHTASDVSIEVDDPAVTFGGDLLWNGMFPNYVDARPSALAASVRAMRRAGATVWIPGHGSVATDADVTRYLDMLGEVERQAREAHARGVPPAEAARGFRLPESLGEWFLFGPTFPVRAFEAWGRELRGGDAGGA
jgi:glyoxylase-like metal-dependent hydrolase (beta-lactamase superfamily II)